MVTAPTVVDPRDWDFKYGDKQQMIEKQNALNQWRYDFSEQLKTMCDELNIEFQYVEETRLDITNKSGQVAADRQAVTLAKQSVDASKAHIDQREAVIDNTAAEVSQNAQQVASDKQVVAQDKQAAASSASAASSSAGAALTAKQQAEALYGDLDAVNTAKAQSQQAAQASTEQAGLASTARQGAEQALADALEALQKAEGNVDAAIAALVDSSPDALNTLNELAAALGDDPNFATTVNNAIADKVPLSHLTSGDHDNRYFTKGQGDSRYWKTGETGYAPDKDLNDYQPGEGGYARSTQANYPPQLSSSGAHIVTLGGYASNDRLQISLPQRNHDIMVMRIMNSGVWGDWFEFLNTRNSDKFNASGAYGNLRAQGTTKADVGLGGVDNYSRAYYDGRYARLAVTNVFAADQRIEKDRPWINLKSPTSGLSGVEQAGGITIGESDNASISVTYTGDGRGHIGMGSVDVNTGIPANEAMELYYQNRNVTFFGDINLPESVTLKGDVSGLKVTNATYGEIVIGNRNANHTHYSSSTGSHYFYGVVRSQEGFNGDGSSVTNVNAVQLNGQSRSVNDDANTVAGRDSAGDIRARLFRSTYTSTNSNIAVIYTAKEADGTDFMRPSTPAQVRAALDVDVPTGANSNGRYYLYPDGRLVMQCGVKTFSQDPASNRRLLASVTLPYTPLGSAEHYVTVNPSSDAGDYTNASSPFDVSGVLVKPGRLSSGSVVEIRLLAQEGRTFATSATTVAPVRIESRWK